jgi:aldehyde dehydrogenase (NAD+)
MEPTIKIQEVLDQLGISPVNPGICTGTEWADTKGEVLNSFSPVDGSLIAGVKQATRADYNKMMGSAGEAFLEWRRVPAPKRGEVVRLIGMELRKYKVPLGRLVSWEMGKIYQEGLGEVQEMIDICDFAVGLSRQLYGRTMHSERPDTGCTSNITRWGSWVWCQHLTSLWPYGHGTP